MIRILTLPDDRQAVQTLLQQLRLDAAELSLSRGALAKQAAQVQSILEEVARHGENALVALARKFDDKNFDATQIRVSPKEMQEAAARVPPRELAAIRRSIAQVRQYQRHLMPVDPPALKRPGVELGLRFTPLPNVGLYVPGGKASYPSTVIMLAVPAQVAGVAQIVVCTPPSEFGRSDLVLAACHELGLTSVFRAGGAAAIAAMAFGNTPIPRVDKIVGPGNIYVQLAKRALAGCVGIDGFLGPSEILVIADSSGRPDFIAADLMAQAEHNPGNCFLLTTSEKLARDVRTEMDRQIKALDRAAAIASAFEGNSAIIVGPAMPALIELANEFAAEHVNIQTRDDQAVLAGLKNAGAIFLGPWSAVAAGDYVAGPSHCLPTNTTARFSSGVSVYEFLKRSSVVRYDPAGLAADADAIVDLANAEHLAGHAASIRIRQSTQKGSQPRPNDKRPCSLIMPGMGPDFVRATVRQMDGYTPGEQPAVGARIVKLNTNENPFPPSPKVMQAIAQIDPEMLRRYPNPTADGFRAAAAKLLGIGPEMIIAGNGSDDLLTIATRTFISPGGTLAFPEPTYSLYPVLARLQDAKFATVAWGDGWSLPTEALLAAGADAIYLANPNAPSGTFIPPGQVSELARRFSGLLLIDEAYVDFADENCLPVLRDRANVLILRSLSKSYGLAGLRFGYGVARREVIVEMMKVKDSYNCDAVSVAAATAAIQDQPYARQTWAHVRAERQRLTAELTRMGWTVLPSQANFILATLPDGRGERMYQGLKKKGILIRYFDKPGLTDKVRITIGTTQQNDALLGGIQALGTEGKAA